MTFWLWIIVLIGSVVFEMLTVSALISIWFAPGAVAALIAMQLGLNFMWQVIIFFAVSLLFILTCRPLAKKYLRGNIVATNADRVIGLHTNLLETITSDKWGTVKLQGAQWHAVSLDGETIEKDSLVEVLAIEGSKVIVKKI